MMFSDCCVLLAEWLNCKKRERVVAIVIMAASVGNSDVLLLAYFQCHRPDHGYRLDESVTCQSVSASLVKKAFKASIDILLALFFLRKDSVYVVVIRNAAVARRSTIPLDLCYHKKPTLF